MALSSIEDREQVRLCDGAFRVDLAARSRATAHGIVVQQDEVFVKAPVLFELLRSVFHR